MYSTTFQPSDALGSINVLGHTPLAPIGGLGEARGLPTPLGPIKGLPSLTLPLKKVGVLAPVRPPPGMVILNTIYSTYILQVLKLIS